MYDCIDRCTRPVETKENSKELDEIKKRITGAGVITEHVQVKLPKKSAVATFVLNCSLYGNSERIFRTDNGGKYTCLNGLRALSMIWIIIGHTFNYLADYKLFFLLCK